ncbi:MAG: DUF742 domain-containing protein [Carbonactinosporaceae bacterium]
MRDDGTDESWFDEGAEHLVRPYIITRGRTRPAQDTFNLITHVTTEGNIADTSHLEPEAAAICDLCRHRALSVAEIAAKLYLPISVVKILLEDLLDMSAISTRAPIAVVDSLDVEIIEAVEYGLRKL